MGEEAEALGLTDPVAPAAPVLGKPREGLGGAAPPRIYLAGRARPAPVRPLRLPALTVARPRPRRGPGPAGPRPTASGARVASAPPNARQAARRPSRATVRARGSLGFSFEK